jgi:hypothetical protein
MVMVPNKSRIAVIGNPMAQPRLKGIARSALIAFGLLVVVLVWTTLLTPPVGAPQYYTSIEQALCSPESVRKLALIKRGLSSIPEGVRQLPNLEDLILSENEISTLPIWFPENKKLVCFGLVRIIFRHFRLRCFG